MYPRQDPVGNRETGHNVWHRAATREMYTKLTKTFGKNKLSTKNRFFLVLCQLIPDFVLKALEETKFSPLLYKKHVLHLRLYLFTYLFRKEDKFPPYKEEIPPSPLSSLGVQ